ncbi:MAG TPA: hypothetical protein VM266_11950 [Solirubrobacteraceae bacterium]|nr:hypothetical protein [Solirubrobacteraceae bacterium]
MTAPPGQPPGDDDPGVNPRTRQRRSSAELAQAVRRGDRVGEALRALDARAEDPDAADLALAHELARFLVRRCADRHHGWQVLRQALIDAGAEVAWERLGRQAVPPAAARILADCAGLGRTPLLRVQHAAAQERARVLAGHVDPQPTLRRLKVDHAGAIDEGAWERALVRAVSARSREKLAALLAQELAA